MTSKTYETTQQLHQLLPMIDFLSDEVHQKAAGIVVKDLTIDSREIKSGSVFVAMQGLHAHGKDFIDQAVLNGACAILVDAGDELISTSVDIAVPVIGVPQLEQALSNIAGRFYHCPSRNLPVIGITGTNGKTTCSQLLAQALACLHQPCGVMGTLGCGVIKESQLQADDNLQDLLIATGMTTTDAITTQKICSQLVGQGAKALAMEVSSHGLIQHRVRGIDINTAVFTNLTHDHLDYHGTMAAYGQAKATLFAMPSVSMAVINEDDEFSKVLVENLRADIKLATYSLKQLDSLFDKSMAHFSFKSIEMGEQGLSALLKTPDGEYPITTKMVGQFNLSNLLSIITTLYINDYSMERIVPLIPLLKPVPGRMELIANQLDIQVVVDYAHTPDALRNALSALLPHTQGKLWCVFGCGGDRDRDKRPEMAAIAEKLADEIVVTSDNPRNESSVQIFADIEQGFQEPREVVADRASAIDFAINNARAGDVILIAGKGHEDYQIIGNQRFPFSDQQHARFSLRQREAEA